MGVPGSEAESVGRRLGLLCRGGPMSLVFGLVLALALGLLLRPLPAAPPPPVKPGGGTDRVKPDM